MKPFDYNKCPEKCPRCNKDDLSFVDESFDLGNVVLFYTCHKCNFTWSELYKFENWEIKK